KGIEDKDQTRNDSDEKDIIDEISGLNLEKLFTTRKTKPDVMLLWAGVRTEKIELVGSSVLGVTTNDKWN
ncbi:14577_t:CDS:2, partial [Racocetra persica]